MPFAISLARVTKGSYEISYYLFTLMGLLCDELTYTLGRASGSGKSLFLRGVWILVRIKVEQCWSSESCTNCRPASFIFL